MSKPVCVVLGVGPGNGAAFARRFAAEGYRTALLARSLDFAEKLASELPDSRAYECDAAEEQSVTAAFEAISEELGEIEVLIYNAGSGTRGTVEEVTTAQLNDALRVNAVGLLASARAVIPSMKSRGRGSIIVVGATASRRGAAKTAAFAPAKAAQKSLTESMARWLWPAGIHVALIVIDGVVDLPRTRKLMPDKSDGFFVQPDAVADTAFWLVRQPRSGWAFEVEARPFGEVW